MRTTRFNLPDIWQARPALVNDKVSESGRDQDPTVPDLRSLRGAFTLIELLVVIAIIGILAALIVGLTSVAGRNKVQSRVKAELNQLVGAIESYHKKHGFYPPDHTKAPPASSFSTNQINALYYELTGTEPPDPVKAAVFNTVGVEGIASTDDTGKGQNFHPNLKPSGFAALPGNADVLLLVVPYKGPAGDYNPWHYNSSSPANNTETYDLWAEVMIDGKPVTIGNWKD
jgi:prepilin-type N-terminal cleavage/methylation domain-containing protein